jgi:hypothetical protein
MQPRRPHLAMRIPRRRRNRASDRRLKVSTLTLALPLLTFCLLFLRYLPTVSAVSFPPTAQCRSGAATAHRPPDPQAPRSTVPGPADSRSADGCTCAIWAVVRSKQRNDCPAACFFFFCALPSVPFPRCAAAGHGMDPNAFTRCWSRYANPCRT